MLLSFTLYPLMLLSHSSHFQLIATPWMTAHQAPLSMGILQARILERVAMPTSRESSQLRDWTQVSHIAGRFFTIWVTREARPPWWVCLNYFSLVSHEDLFLSLPPPPLSSTDKYLLSFRLPRRRLSPKELMLSNCGAGEDSWESLVL